MSADRAWESRMLCDGTIREEWKTARYQVVGASDWKILAHQSSVEKYLRGKLRREVFSGNVFTENGYRWEPMILGWAGYEHNTALFHAPDETGFAATPDGIRVKDGVVSLAEVKVKHVTLDSSTKGPQLGEWRQLAGQFRVFPEVEFIDWCWGDVDKCGDPEELVGDEPHFIRIYRDDPKIVALTEKTEPIARELLTRLRAALEFDKEIA